MLQWRRVFASRRWLLTCAIIGIALFAHYSGVAAPAEFALARAIQPVQGVVYRGTQRLFTTATPEPVQDQQALQDQIQQLLIENAHLKTVVQESGLLQDQLAFLEQRSLRALNGRVVSRSTEALSETLILNVGSKNGVQIGMPAIIDDGVLVGVIRSVTDYASELLLLTSYSSEVSAAVQNEQRSPGIVRGEHNLSLLMDFIPQLDTVRVQDAVFTNGTDPAIPQGLLLGQVQEVIHTPGSLFQQAVLQPFFKANDIAIVSIIIQ